ncbi:MAG TPA: hypothetical protein VJ794_02180, partial [Gemmatimonadales bacterium]|nr:hypothetical protein [Gemmatimonadales bacterium]
MTAAHYRPRRRRGLAGLFGSIDDFMSWLLYGHETWLVALLKGVPLFLFMYFLIFYIPNYIYYAVTLYVFDFSKDVGFLVSNLIGGGNFTALIVMAVWAQAARGRQGFFWSLIRYLVFAQYLLTVLLLIPFMVFNLGGGSLIPPVFTLQSLGLGAAAAGMGLMSAIYLVFEFRRITRREA